AADGDQDRHDRRSRRRHGAGRGRPAGDRDAPGRARLRGHPELHRPDQELPARDVQWRVQDRDPVVSERRRVLLVDDDPTIHRAVVRMLAGFDLCSVYDGPSALTEIETALAQRAEYALVVLDIGMPGWGGLETLERIWRVAPDTQALFCTGEALGYH